MSLRTPSLRVATATLLALTASSCTSGTTAGGVSGGRTPLNLSIPTTTLGAFESPRDTVQTGGRAVVADARTDQLVAVDLGTAAREVLADETTLAGGARVVDNPGALTALGDFVFIANVGDNSLDEPGSIARVDVGEAPAAPIVLATGATVHKPQGIEAVTVELPDPSGAKATAANVLFVANVDADRRGSIAVLDLGATGAVADAYLLDPGAAGVTGDFETRDFENLCDVAFQPAAAGSGLVGRLFTVALGPRADDIGCRADTDPSSNATPSYAGDTVTVLDLIEDSSAPGRLRVSRAESRTNQELVAVIGIGFATARAVGIARFHSIPNAMFVSNRGAGILSVVGLNEHNDLVLLTTLPVLVDSNDEAVTGVNLFAGVESVNIGTADEPQDRTFVSMTSGTEGQVRYFESILQ